MRIAGGFWMLNGGGCPSRKVELPAEPLAYRALDSLSVLCNKEQRVVVAMNFRKCALDRVAGSTHKKISRIKRNFLLWRDRPRFLE
jgi:hypothetical protein